MGKYSTVEDFLNDKAAKINLSTGIDEFSIEAIQRELTQKLKLK